MQRDPHSLSDRHLTNNVCFKLVTSVQYHRFVLSDHLTLVVALVDNNSCLADLTGFCQD